MATLLQQSESTFYVNTVLAEDFDYTVVSDPEPLELERGEQPETIVSRVGRGVAMLVTGGMLVFGPLGLTAPPNHTLSPEAIEQVIVHVLAPGVSEVAVPDVHQQAAARFQKLFKAVALNDVEKKADPDYGL